MKNGQTFSTNIKTNEKKNKQQNHRVCAVFLSGIIRCISICVINICLVLSFKRYAFDFEIFIAQVSVKLFQIFNSSSNWTFLTCQALATRDTDCADHIDNSNNTIHSLRLVVFVSIYNFKSNAKWKKRAQFVTKRFVT